MSNKLILVEHAYQVELFNEYFCSLKFEEEYVVLAISPSAQVELRKRGTPFIKSNHYFTNEDHRSVSEKSHEMTKLIRENFWLEDNFGVRHAYETEFVNFFRHHYLNYWLSVIKILDNAVDDLSIDTIYVPSSPIPQDFEKNIAESGTMLGYICQHYSAHKGLDVSVHHDPHNLKVSKSALLPDFIKRLSFSLQLCLYKLMCSKKYVIWATHSAYNIPRVMESLSKNVEHPFLVGGTNHRKLGFLWSFLRRERFKLHDFPPPPSKQGKKIFLAQYDCAIRRIKSVIRENKAEYTFLGTSMEHPIVAYLENGLRNQLQETFKGVEAFFRVIKQRKPDFLISNQATGFHYAIGELCCLNNIKAMLISHGTHVSHSNSLARAEWKENSHFMIYSHFPMVAAQTPLMQKFLDDTEPVLSLPVLTGPLLFSKPDPNKDYKALRRHLYSENHEKKIILHAATPFPWNNFQPWITLTQDEYVHQINDLIRVVENIPNSFLAIRVRLKSFGGMSLNAIRSLFVQSDCYEVCVEGAFEDYLLTSDLLVSFSSTTIEEALQNKIPVLQYDPFNRYSHIPATHLKTVSLEESVPSAVYYVSSYNDLSTGLNWIIDEHLRCKTSQSSVDWNNYIMHENDWISNLLV